MLKIDKFLEKNGQNPEFPRGWTWVAQRPRSALKEPPPVKKLALFEKWPKSRFLEKSHRPNWPKNPKIPKRGGGLGFSSWGGEFSGFLPNKAPGEQGLRRDPPLSAPRAGWSPKWGVILGFFPWNSLKIPVFVNFFRNFSKICRIFSKFFVKIRRNFLKFLVKLSKIYLHLFEFFD